MSRSVELVGFKPGRDGLNMWGQSENPGDRAWGGVRGIRMGVVVTVARS